MSGTAHDPSDQTANVMLSQPTNTDNLNSHAHGWASSIAPKLWDQVTNRNSLSVRMDEIHFGQFMSANIGFFIASYLVFYPAELLKTRQQVSRHVHAGSGVDPYSLRGLIKDLYAKRGVRGLFHGFAITSFSGVAVNAASIASYLYLRDAFMDKFNLDIRSAGAASGAMTELFVAPFAIPSQVVSQRVRIAPLASNGQSGFGQTLEVCKYVYKSEGYKGFYRGTAASLWFNAPSQALAWGSYEGFKIFFNRAFPIERNSEAPGQRLLAQQMLSAACAAAFSSTIMNPLDIARTRIQVSGLQANASGREDFNSKRGTLAVFHELKILIRNEGFQSLSKGLLPRLCMAVPVATLESIFYEVTLSLFSKNQKRD